MSAPYQRRRLISVSALAAIALLLGWLLMPLADRAWTIAKPESNASGRDDYLAAERSAAATAWTPPNVVLIVADDLSYTDLSIYNGIVGTAPGPTPAIDSIGRDGVTFTQANATATICAPSRAALLTGRYQQRFGFELQPHDQYARNRLEYLAFRYAVNMNHMVPIGPQPIPPRRELADQGIPATEVTLADLLRARGFGTAIFGKWHLGYTPEFGPLSRGFDEHYGFYEAFSLYAPQDDPDIVNAPIDDFSDKHIWSKGRSGASAIVHDDVVVDDREYLTFRFADLASDYVRAHADEPFFLYVPFNAPHTPLQAPKTYYDRFSWIDDPTRRTYAAMIAALDDAVAEILASIHDAGIDDNTIVVFTSDNGGASYLGVTDNGSLGGGKFTYFEGGTEVPLLIRYPGHVPAGEVYAEPVSLLDVFATVDAVTAPPAPVQRPATLATDGVDLIPYVVDPTRTGRPHEELFWRSIYNKAIRVGEWKLMVTTDGSPSVADGESRVELYNLSLDRSERTDVAAEHPEIVHDLLCRLATWEHGLAKPLWPPVVDFWIDIWGRRYWYAI